jgi:hypothetical protein
MADRNSSAVIEDSAPSGDVFIDDVSDAHGRKLSEQASNKIIRALR